MYISGKIVDYASRLHQLPTGTGDLISFLIEGSGYTGIPTKNQLNKWNTEFAVKFATLTNNENYFISPALSIITING